ncbi:MAG TPA: Yip1 family protein [Phycisphaerales bacterium]|nr:Yip1 family protein [Phycisphaerales bacterium]
MRCTQCDYALWNLPARNCPECGKAFAPSEYEFVPNAVQFICPHCAQAYYGTTQKGHLDPVEFECLCGHHVHMDGMILLPTQGVSEFATVPDAVPWLERNRRGRFSAWFKTVWGSLIQPHRMIHAAPGEKGTLDAWLFAVITIVITALISVLPFLLFLLIPLGMGAGGAGALWFLAFMGVFFGTMTLGWLIGIVLWGAATHILLRMTGTLTYSIGRTYQALCYSSGANITSALPCFGGYIGWIWWVISATIMTKTAHRIGGGRAAFAVLTPPLTFIILLIGGYVALIYSVMAAAPGMMGGGMFVGSQASGTTAQRMATLLENSRSNSQWPVHVLTYVPDGLCHPWEFVTSSSMTTPDVVPVGSSNLINLSFLDVRQQRAMINEAVAAMPEHLVAYRVGDCVFTYPGLPADPDPDLWLLIVWPDPVWNPSPPNTVWVGTPAGNASGTSRRSVSFRLDEFEEALAEQNRLREQWNLPPLPHPQDVLHGKDFAAPPKNMNDADH